MYIQGARTSRSSQFVTDLDKELELLGVSLWLKNALDRIDDQCWTKGTVGQTEYTVFKLSKVKQVVDERLHKVKLAHDKLEIASNYRVNLNLVQ